MPCSRRTRRTSSWAAQLVPDRGGLALKLSVLPGVGNQNADLEETRVAVDAHAVLIEPLARLSLPIGDGGGQQFSCRSVCDTANWNPPGTRLMK